MREYKTGVSIFIDPDTGVRDIDIKGMGPEEAVKLIEETLTAIKENLPAAIEIYKKTKSA